MTATVWSKFFWSDWKSDPNLRACSFAARGLWMDMLCIMAMSPEFGMLIAGGEPLDAMGISRQIGGDPREIETLLGELEKRGVFSRNRAGTIYSRRLVKESKKRSMAAENGAKGGNPKLRGEYAKPGFVYVIGPRSDGLFKIGASVNPAGRLKKLRAQFKGDDLAIVGAFEVENMGKAERALHEELRAKPGAKLIGEWGLIRGPSPSATLSFVSHFLEALKGPSMRPSGISQMPDARSQSSSSYAAPTEPRQQPGASLFEEVVHEAGVDRSGRLPTHWMPPAAELHVERWRSDLGLSTDEVLAVIRQCRMRHADPPSGPKAFDRAMQALANAKAQPALQPANGAAYDQPRLATAADRRADARRSDADGWADAAEAVAIRDARR